MAGEDKKISELTSLSPVADDDLIVVVDVSDPTQAPSGTTKKALKSELKGDKGDAATVDAGTTTTLAAGASATVTNVGTTSAAIFNFGIPQGIQGIPGADGTDGACVQSVAFVGNDMVFTLTDSSTITLTGAKTDLKGDAGETGAKIVSASFVGDDLVFVLDDASTVTVTNAKVDLKGDQGIQGVPGADGLNGTDGADGVSLTFQGPWITGFAYNAHASISTDLVEYGGSTYICAIAHTSGVFADDLANGYWLLAAQKGADGTGSGDMLASVYDPTSVAGDAFDMDNMVEGSTNKLVSATEKSTWSGKQDTLESGVNIKTINSESLLGSGDIVVTGGLSWIAKSGNYTAADSEGILANTSGGSWTLTLPATPNIGDTVGISDSNSSFDANNLTIGRNGSKIMGAAEDLVVDIKDASFTLVYSGSDTGWKIDTLLPAASAFSKASASDINTGTDDAKYVTSKGLSDQTVLAKTASPTFTGTVTLPTTQLGEVSLKLDSTLSADEKWSGITTSGTAGATLAVGDLCYLNNDDGRWELVDANLSDGYNKQLGMCVLASTDGNATEMLVFGKIRSAAFPAFTVGSPLYVSETAGDITHTQPTTADVCIRIVGFALTAEDMLFNPSNDYIVHA